MMNFQMAADMLDIENATVTINDDVAVENSTHTTGRRGVGGTLIIEKILGAASEQGESLAELKILGDSTNNATASMGVALTSCIVPAAGKPTFEIGPKEMEMGVGIHGEPGRRRVELTSADEIASELTAAIVNDLSLKTDQQVIMLVNGFGGTPLLELYLMANSATKILKARGIRIARYLVGSYITSLEMAGCSITLTAVDDKLLKHWDAPVHTAALRWGR
jgi:dihydroxyacetone kinase-like protein